jgi:hypothetical protein
VVLLWAAVGGVVALLALWTRNGFSWRDFTEVTLLLAWFAQVVYVTFRSLLTGAGAFARERELQTLDTLLASPLPVRDLVVGKWMATAWPVAVEILWSVPLSLGLGLTFRPQQIQVGTVFEFTLLNLALVALGTTVGLFVSSRAQNTSKASLRTTIFGLCLLLGTYVGDVVLEWMGGVPVPFLCTLNPLWATYSIMAGCEEPNPTHFSTDLWCWSTLVYVVCAAALAYGVLLRMRRPLGD